MGQENGNYSSILGRTLKLFRSVYVRLIQKFELFWVTGYGGELK